jgi:hypothetical protein
MCGEGEYCWRATRCQVSSNVTRNLVCSHSAETFPRAMPPTLSSLLSHESERDYHCRGGDSRCRLSNNDNAAARASCETCCGALQHDSRELEKHTAVNCHGKHLMSSSPLPYLVAEGRSIPAAPSADQGQNCLDSIAGLRDWRHDGVQLAMLWGHGDFYSPTLFAAGRRELETVICCGCRFRPIMLRFCQGISRLGEVAAAP